ncbi:DUF2231 domain-containing protein [Lysobacter sp. D1-1-M9]|uniref:DUF2231 domain-containing protein n=1 Tax=Novilysobacter longmucuonensis TaxID=3098603 RepID=UPI002FC77231
MFGRSKKNAPPKKYTRKVPSVMALHKHPIHPMLVVFPIAFLGTMFLTDMAYVLRGDEFWALVSFWLNLGGLVMGVIAGAIGMGDFMILREVRNHVSAWSHFIAAVMLLALAAAGVWLRWPDPVAAIWPWGLLLSAVTAAAVMVVGWLGGTLSFRHGVGVYGEKPPPPDAEGNTPAAE